MTDRRTARVPGRTTPPRPVIAFRVGVVGHRPDRLPAEDAGLAAVRGAIAQVLEAVSSSVRRFAAGPGAALYAPGAESILTACSPLAEGADRIFAEEARRLGYRLTCVMPFPIGEFEQDFSGPLSFETGSLERFRRILDEAEAAGALTRFELNGRRERDREAYEAAGRVVLNQSDLLVVIWDGGAAAGMGGTVDTLREAISLNVPTLWIDSRAPHGWKIMRSAEDLDCLGGEEPCPAPPAETAGDINAVIDALVNSELALDGVDAAPGEHAAPAHLKEYLAETRPRLNLAFLWKLFRDFMDVGRLHPPSIHVAPFESQIRADWQIIGDPGSSAAMTPPATSWINARLRGHYAWSDKLADLYADKHRSSFVASSLLAATAVFIALVPVAGHFGPRASLATAIFELFILVLMVGLPIVARLGRWHQRWLEYRVLAELVRALRILIPLGGARPLPRTAAHLASYGDPAQSWMNWEARAIARAVGLPEARITASYIKANLDYLLDFLGTTTPPHGQIGFHHINCERMERIHHRLHRMSLILFSASIAAVGCNWLVRFLLPAMIDRVNEWLILFSAFLPALGATIAAINNQGEFARLQRRSHAMADSLRAVHARVLDLDVEPHPPPLATVSELAAQIASMMVEENIEWRIVVLDVPHAG
jgi:hypothetical protein